MVEVSIVVPSHRGAHRLPTIIESFGRQSLGRTGDIEMVVVIDGDVDGSRTVAEQAAGDLPVRVIAFPENRGRAAALNAGFEAARGDVLVRADDDLDLEEDFAEHHWRLHQSSRCGVVGMCRDVFPDTPYARVYGVHADRKIREMAFQTPPERTWRWWSGNVSTTRDDHDRVGRYDESFREYGWEDIDWGYRLHLLGVPIVIPEDFSTLHRGPVTTTVEKASRAFSTGAARRRFLQKHGADVLGEPDPELTVWNAMVAVASLAATERTIPRMAAVADRTIGRMRPWAGEKTVALLVQAAARSGARAG